MPRRAGWENLSPAMQARYTRTLGQGNPRQAERLYNRGVPLGRARGHGGGAARPAPHRPASERTRQIRQQREKLARQMAELRATAKFTSNVTADRGRKHHPGERYNLNEIRSRLSGLTTDQLEQVAAMTPAQQRDWLAARASGPADANELYYHGSLAWSP